VSGPVAVLAPEPIRPRMAGMGIRALEFARALAAESPVRLLVPNDPSEAREVAGGLEVVRAAGDSLADAARGARAAVVSGHAANAWFHGAPGVPVACDLYDPYPVENLHYAALLGEATARHDRESLALALARADFFLCASPEQRLFYAGALFAAGRIGGGNFPGDPSLAGLVGIVPFGVPETPADGDRARGRRALGVPDSGPLVLFGGIYDWYDPGPLLEAWPSLSREQPDARLVFFENPNPESTPQRAFAGARKRAGEIDPDGRSIFFSPWQPYAARADLYAAADVAVSIASAGLETELAYRTRVLDAAWGGLPSIAVHGGTIVRELAAAGGAVECAADPAALARAVGGLLRDGEARRRAAAAARRFAADRTWRIVTAPLRAWLRGARVDPGRTAPPGSPPRRRRLFRS